MARKNNNFTILADVELNTSTIKKQLQGYKFNIDDKSFKNLSQDAKVLTENLKSSREEADSLNLSFQAANEVLSKTIEIVSAMTQQVFELDEKLIEFQKVSDLSGRALDEYVSKLSEMGQQVARTG